MLVKTVEAGASSKAQGVKEGKSFIESRRRKKAHNRAGEEENLAGLRECEGKQR